jgi:CRISPR/Cas system Type II protein with McrA/HNH and RuvC-like nuclease domain
MTNLPAKPDIDRELVKQIAMDIGKEVVAHIRVMYPEAAKALGKSGQLSVRNCTHNEIMEALSTTDADEIVARIARRKSERRRHVGLYEKIRREDEATRP